MKIKKRTITILAVVLVFALAFGAVAAVYILQQAKVNVFSGHLDFSHANQPVDNSQSELIVKVDGVEVGHEGTVTGYGEDAIPVLADVESRYIDWNNYVWEDKSGNQALAAKEFFLTSKNGDLDNLTYDINVIGNPSIISVLRFGLVTEYNNDENGRTARISSAMIDRCMLPELLGDGNITEGEEIRVSVFVWADAYALADLDYFDNMDFNIDIVFSAGKKSE